MAASDNKFPLLPRLIATTLGCGYWPWGPGTMGAVGGVVLWLPLLLTGNTMVVFGINAALVLIFTFLGAWSGTVAERYWGPDPSRVVMDETVGQWLAMMPLAAFASCPSPWAMWQMWTGVALSLALFRFFDIVKPLGVRSMERFPGGWGIMADDILAGIYSAVLVMIYIAVL
ncbi:MAG: phosphatidylglycerophosphatase A [Muribaculaceae bacterium]|nr:phosphatidylglycerophosphatase A [Muribaculaceae bacterium]